MSPPPVCCDCDASILLAVAVMCGPDVVYETIQDANRSIAQRVRRDVTSQVRLLKPMKKSRVAVPILRRCTLAASGGGLVRRRSVGALSSRNGFQSPTKC